MKNKNLIIGLTLALSYSVFAQNKLIDTTKHLSLEATNISNNKFNLIYNSIDTIPTTLIINKKIIATKSVRHLLDTLKMHKYNVFINREKRQIVLTSK